MAALAAAAAAVVGPRSAEEREALSDAILRALAELTRAHRTLAQGAEADAKRSELHAQLIPLLERAIFTPNDDTMRIVYRRVYSEEEDDALAAAGPDRFEMMREPLVLLSKAFGEAWSRPESRKLIPQFKESYGVSLEGLVKREADFASLNEFFYREIDLACRPLQPAVGEPDKVVSSMADSHVMVFRPWSTLRELVVKNKQFTVAGFLGPRYGAAADMEGGTIVCVRLDPRHIHRAFAPMDGVLGEPWEGGVAYHTTKPVGIENLRVDTLGENKRVVLPLATAHGTLYTVFVGGPLIGSVTLTAGAGARVKRGQELAYFGYGGSAIYMCLPRDFAAIDWAVPENKTLDGSQEVQLRSTLGQVA